MGNKLFKMNVTTCVYKQCKMSFSHFWLLQAAALRCTHKALFSQSTKIINITIRDIWKDSGLLTTRVSLNSQMCSKEMLSRRLVSFRCGKTFSFLIIPLFFIQSTCWSRLSTDWPQTVHTVILIHLHSACWLLFFCWLAIFWAPSSYAVLLQIFDCALLAFCLLFNHTHSVLF